jgi:hypothetical protein
LAEDDDLEMRIDVGLDAIVEERSIKPVGIGAVGELLVAEDGWIFEELLIWVLEMDLGCASRFR